MTTLRLRHRYLALLGLSGALAGCRGGGGGGETPTADGTATSGPVVGDPPATSATATAQTATAVATASADRWQPTVPKPAPTQIIIPDNDEPRATCPSGEFCVRAADASGSPKAKPPFGECALQVPPPDPPPPSTGEQKVVSFNLAQTQRERTAISDACCYTWVIPCPGGRPLVIEGAVRTADVATTAAWLDRPLGAVFAALPPEVRASLGDHYSAEAAYEHASVASFSRVSLSLLAAGAPPDLIADTHRAALDEIEHARSMYSMASACRGVPVGPGPLDLSGASPAATSVVDIAEEAFFEGCVGEVTAALVLREEAAAAIDPACAEILSRMAEDEERHAELAWRTVAWALSREPVAVGAMLSRARASAAASAMEIASARSDDSAAARLPGVTTARQRALIRGRAILEITEPCVAALLERDTTA